jgi:hypothetical protein
MFIYNVVYFSFRSVTIYPVLSSTRATRLASLMLIQAPHDKSVVVTDTMTITDTDMLHALALCSWKLHYFFLCTDTDTDRLPCVCQIQTGYCVSARHTVACLCLPDTDRQLCVCQTQTGYCVSARYRQATRFSNLFSDIPATLNVFLLGQSPEFHIYRKLHN